MLYHTFLPTYKVDGGYPQARAVLDPPVKLV